MNPVVAHPAIQLLARGFAVGIVVWIQWWSMNPDRFIAHAEARAEHRGESLREAVRVSLAARGMQFAAPMIFFVTPELYFSLLQGAALLTFLSLTLAAMILSRRSQPPAILKRRWMADFDQWWNYPGMAIREHRARADSS